MKQLDPTELKRLHRRWRHRTARRLAVACDGLGTPVNVGSIVRTAAAYGVDHLWLAGPTPDPDAGGAAKTAMGTERYLDVRRVDTGLDAVTAAKAAGYTVIALELTDDAAPLFELAPDGPVCVVVGHEDHGVNKATLAAVDQVAYLPLVGRIGSLNVAVSCSIAIAELRRQEWQNLKDPSDS